MRHLIPILFFSLLLVGCQPDEKKEDAYPTDLKGKKTLLKEKKSELRDIQVMIEKLEGEINELAPPAEKKRRLVTAEKVTRKDFKHYVEIQASVQAEESIAASSETGGRITQLLVKENQYVKKGDLIAKTDMEAVTKQIAELQKSLELAREVHIRQKRLWDQNIGSEMQYLKAKNDMERLEKSIETVSFQTTKANVYAPASGVVDMVLVEAGEMAGPGAPILMILNTGSVKVVADVPETYLGSVRRGQRVKISFPALELEKTARVSLLGRTINPANRTFPVEVAMSSMSGKLKPNLLATMLLNDFTEKDAVVIPLELVQQEISGKNFVYVKSEGDEGALAKKVYVETGESFEADIHITSGLEGDEEIIIDGARGLTDNELIQVVEPTNSETNE